MNTKKLLRQFFQRRRSKKTLGFTLIELLVGMVLAFLVMAPMLGFMVNMLDSDNREQAKATTEQEVQAALDYIARDLQQAIYIYGVKALSNPSSTNVDSGIKDQIPPTKAAPGCSDAAKCIPILAFWKRQLIENSKIDGNPNYNPYVYSLVVYYQIIGNSGSTAWSNSSRIGRFEIRDGVRKSPPPTLAIGAAKDDPELYYAKNDPDLGIDDGFALFEINKSISTLDLNMNRWKGSGAFKAPVATLVDYIDQSEWQKNSSTTLQCPINPATITTTKPNGDPLGRIPKEGSEVKGFYSCVDSSLWVAQVFIRGNAMFRFKADCTPTKTECKYNDNNEASRVFFPRSTVQVRGQGFLDVQQD